MKINEKMKIANTDRESLHILRELKKFNENFRRDVTYNNMKSHKKARFHPNFRIYIFGKTTGWGVKLPHPPAFLWLSSIFVVCSQKTSPFEFNFNFYIPVKKQMAICVHF